ncbi:anti-sigma factor [Microcoleus sp. FACHB-1515]|uniref:anti-sigma factor n=1 Tax=Cyanophyceae TaxID=3028117 RepID=UPI00168462F1|nr:anti-sigma factor [Microcoleus sp. FACHB-1515]MBD2089836.1 anti-sigma factor [Microcoleus sp. FACHB-1515]
MAMLPPEQQELIAGYVLGDLLPEEAAEFEQLLAQDSAIAAEVAQMQQALELAYAPSEIAPPAQLRSTILAKANERSVAAVGRFSQRAMAIAAASCIAVLAGSNYWLWRGLQTTQVEPQSAPLTYSLQPTDANLSAAAATVSVDPNRLEATIEMRNLPPLQADQVYVLWTVLTPNAPYTTDAKQAILTKVFQVDDRGNFTQTIAVPEVYRNRDLVAKVAVTIESATAPQKHTGSPILITNS